MMSEVPDQIWVRLTDQVYKGKRGMVIDNEPFNGAVRFVPETSLTEAYSAGQKAERERCRNSARRPSRG